MVTGASISTSAWPRLFPGGCTSPKPAGRTAVALGAAAYLSLPVVRAVRERAGVTASALIPVALATKDLGKLAGAVQGVLRRRSR